MKNQTKNRGSFIKRTPVKSSTLRSVGYDQETHVLELEFTSKEVYLYFIVPRFHYEGLINAPSIGTYFNTHIKNQYPTKKK